MRVPISSSTGCTARTTNGNVTNANATNTGRGDRFENGAHRAVVPVQCQHLGWRTMVGNANGRSIIASTIRLPTKSSRTSTQAISKPNTRLMTVTAVRNRQRYPERLPPAAATRPPARRPPTARGLPNDGGQRRLWHDRKPHRHTDPNGRGPQGRKARNAARGVRDPTIPSSSGPRINLGDTASRLVS